MLPMLQAISTTGVPSLVRVPWNEPGTIMKALDAGAGGGIAPMINSVAEAEAVVGACRYPPAGFRSMGPTRAPVVDAAWRQPLGIATLATLAAAARVPARPALPRA